MFFLCDKVCQTNSPSGRLAAVAIDHAIINTLKQVQIHFISTLLSCWANDDHEIEIILVKYKVNARLFPQVQTTVRYFSVITWSQLDFFAG